MTNPDTCGAVLTIDLDAIAANYRLLSARLGAAACAGVVKADAYGLGVRQIAPVLAAAGCQTFFVATADEGIELRQILGDAEIHVLNGCPHGAEPEFVRNGLIPVINSLRDVGAWAAFAVQRGQDLLASLHVDTGMARLGLPSYELDALVEGPSRLRGVELCCVMSHLACGSEPQNPMNARQLSAFRDALRVLPPARASLVSSSGVFLGPDYHFQLGRPGAAIYGLSPVTSEPNPMTQVISLKGKILQVRDVDTPQTVGYGATHHVAGPSRLATVAVGYADGYLRSLSNSGFGYIGDVRVPVVGRVSMDLIVFDVTGIPEEAARPGGFIDLIGPQNSLDQVADAAGTIGYELLTALGSRYHREYTGGTGA